MSSIIRVQKSDNYMVMSRTVLNDTRLSWKAKGILAYMLSMPDDWVFYMDELVQHAADGKDSFRSGFNELKKYGYVERKPVKDPKTKKITAWETIVYETPFMESPDGGEPIVERPHVEHPQMDKPAVENPPLLNTDCHQVLTKQNTDKYKILKKEKPQRQKHVFDDASFELRMANKLYACVKREVRAFKQPNLQSWAQHIYYMRRDGMQEEEIDALIDWATSHAFWKAHIVSTKKLREKATTLMLQMKAVSQRPSSFTASNEQRRVEVVPEWFHTRHDNVDETVTAQEEAALEAERQRVLKKLGYAL